MKFLNKLACAAAVAMTFTGAASAAQVLTDWRFNPNGGGFAAAQNIEEYLDVNGQSFIQLTPTGERSFSFVEHAVFNIVQADSNGQLFPLNYTGGNISALFEGFGQGTRGTGTTAGSFAFTGGSIRIFQNPTNGQYGTRAGIYGANLGNEIATFKVMAGGGGDVDASGSPIANGQVSVFARADAGDLDPGYFFRGDGSDLSTGIDSVVRVHQRQPDHRQGPDPNPGVGSGLPIRRLHRRRLQRQRLRQCSWPILLRLEQWPVQAG
jgi:hypothetical protein